MKNYPWPILSFLKRYWLVLILFAVLSIISKIDAVTYAVGSIFYLIYGVVACAVCAPFAIHLFAPKTLDAFAQEEKVDGLSPFQREWAALTGAQRLRYRLIALGVIFSGSCIIFASIAK